MLTPPDKIKERLTQWLDTPYLDSLYRRIQYTLGRPWQQHAGITLGGQGAGRFPDYPDVVADFVDVGASRRILNTQFKAMAKTMYSDLSPEFPQVPKHIGEVRKQFWLARAGGDGYADGEWSDEFASAFMEGDGLGIGFLQVGLETNPETDYQRVTLRHSPTILTIYDRTQPKLSRAKGVCFVKYLAPDVAYGLYGKKNMEKYVKPLVDQMRSNPLRVVRVFDYYDIGYGVPGKPGYCEPTHCVIPGDISNEPLYVEKNEFGCLPWAYYVHFYAPWMRHPIGRIELQVSTQEAINELERILREAAHKQLGVDLVDITQIHPDDIRRWRRGEVLTALRLKNAIKEGQQPPIVRIPPQQLGGDIIRLFELYERQYNDDANTTEYDRGNLSAAKRTATEAELLATRTQDSGNWGTLQAQKMYERTVNTVFKIAAKFDHDPLTIDLWGTNVKLNDPDTPASAIAGYLSEHSKVVINADDLSYQDTLHKRAQRMAELQSYVPLIQMGQMDPRVWAEEIVKNAGDDPAEMLVQQGQGGGQQGPPPPRVTDIFDSKTLGLLLPSEFAQWLQEAGIQPDSSRLQKPQTAPQQPVGTQNTPTGQETPQTGTQSPQTTNAQPPAQQ